MPCGGINWPECGQQPGRGLLLRTWPVRPNYNPPGCKPSWERRLRELSFFDSLSGSRKRVGEERWGRRRGSFASQRGCPQGKGQVAEMEKWEGGAMEVGRARCCSKAHRGEHKDARVGRSVSLSHRVAHTSLSLWLWASSTSSTAPQLHPSSTNYFDVQRDTIFL